MSGNSNIKRVRVNLARLDAAASPEFKRELAAILPAGHARVLLDLGAVEFIDSTGIGVLVGILKAMGPNGRIAVTGARSSVARLFQITQLDSIFKLCADENEALRVLGE